VSQNNSEYQIPDQELEQPQPAAEISYTEDVYRAVVEVQDSPEQLEIYSELLRLGESIDQARQRYIDRKLATKKTSRLNTMLRKLVGDLPLGLAPEDESNIRIGIYNELVNEESSITSELLDRQPHIGQQMFFNLSSPEWYLHQQRHSSTETGTSRYVVNPEKGVFISTNSAPYEKLSDEDVERLLSVVQGYQDHIANHLYDPSDFDLAA